MLTPRMAPPADERIGVAIVGAGFIARGLVHRVLRRPSMAPPLLVARRPERARDALVSAGVPDGSIVLDEDPTRLAEALADGRPAITPDPAALGAVPGIDVVVEATGSIGYGIRVMLEALAAGRHVVSPNAEADALVGHHLEDAARSAGATYTISDGDQPGVLLRMVDEAHELGLEVSVALNCKGKLDVHQTRADSRPYAERDGTSVVMTTAFGDGTKMHVEDVVVANLTGLRPPPLGTPGVATHLARVADDVRAAGIPDGSVHFTLGGDFGGGVVVLARSLDPDFDAGHLRFPGKLGDGPWYPLFRPYHLTHLEMCTTIEQVARGGPALGRRTPEPVAVCVAIAKRALRSGERLDGIGGDGSRGEAASAEAAQGLLPMGLSEHATLVRDVAADRPIALEDVELDDEPVVRLALAGR